MHRVIRFALAVFVGAQMVAVSNAASATQPVVRVSAGVWHTCALSADRARCWGDDSYGQASVPSDLEAVAQVAAGWYHTCALTVSGSVRCWGRNDWGQAAPPLELPPLTQVAAGLFDTCGIDRSGDVHCWGDNRHGEVNVPELPGTALKVELGTAYACALTATHLLRCWGYHGYVSASPWADTAVADFDAGSEHACAIGMSGEIKCWGLAWDGEAQTTPPSGLNLANRIASAGYHTCALLSDQTVFCWGRDTWGQTDVPRGLGAVASLALGAHHSCAVTTSNGIRCWGLNDRGQTDVPSELAPSGPLQMPGTNHWYQLISTGGSWQQAREAAVAMSSMGLHGHLVNITSQKEQDFVWELSAHSTVWVGGMDAGPSANAARNWVWADGPEAGQAFTTCSTSYGTTCRTELGQYSAWDSVYNQPDGSPETVMASGSNQGREVWHDCLRYRDNCSASGFVVEFEPTTAPSVPISVSALPGDSAATVTWVAGDGGASSSVGYTITSSPGGKTCTTSDFSCTVTGLTNRQAYTFTVTATNAAGTSEPSAPSAAVMPLAPGFQMWPTESVLAIGSSTALLLAHSAAGASIAISGSTKATATADSTGFATASFTAVKVGIQKFTAAYSVKVGKKTTKYTATTQLYVPSVSGPLLKIKPGKAGKFSLQFMPPGAAVSIALTDGQTMFGIADAAGKANFTPTFTTKGAVNYSVTVAGVQIATGGLTVI